MPKITKSLWRDDLTQEQIEEAEKKLKEYLIECEKDIRGGAE